MRVERVLQWHIAAVSIFGALFLGVARQSALAPLVVTAAAGASLYFTDQWRWFRLHSTIAFLAAIAALGVSFGDFLYSDGAARIAAIANLLICLQIILLFVEKTVRVYAQLVIMSLLQTVISAVLSLGIGFGAMLAVYMTLIFMTLLVLYFHREAVAQRLRGAMGATGASGADGAPGIRNAAAEDRPSWRAALGGESSARAVNQGDELGSVLMRAGLIRHAAALSIAAMVFSVVLFFSVPRYKDPAGSNGAFGAQPQVGFTPEVTLSGADPMGEILQSTRTVMRVRFFHHATNASFSPDQELYYRGSVLTEYSQRGNSGNWIKDPLSSRAALRRAGEISGLVRQEVTANPTGDSRLYSIFPAYRVGATPQEVVLANRDQYLLREPFSYRQRHAAVTYRFSVATTAFRGGVYRRLTPQGEFVDHDLAAELKRALVYPKEALPVVAATAAQVIADANLQGASAKTRAEALERHFHAPLAYTYSLGGEQIERDKKLDPIEDFVANHRTGHCEYFASALVLMLRSQGIPARLVVGYRGGEHNPLGAYYLVRDLNAHAWVEAYLEPEDIAATMSTMMDECPRGGWLRLDPTPASVEAEFEGDMGLVIRMKNFIGYTQMMWDDYVQGLNSETQQREIYGPITDRAAAAVAAVEDSAIWQWLKNGLRRGDWRAIVALFGLFVGVGLSFFAAVRSGGPLLRRLSGLLGSRGATARRRAGRPVAFYGRFERLLARRGLRRRPAQTQREFAETAARRLAALPQTAAAAKLPGLIVEAFYRVRFSDGALDNPQAESIENALAQLETTLGKTKI